MKELLELITDEVKAGFTKAGLDASYGRVTVSNRPDLCEYQCNGAMAAAKQYHKAPIVMAEAVAECLKDSSVFSKVEAVKPGFLNFDLSAAFLSDYVNQMASNDHFGLEAPEKPLTIILDYGGPNVAKPLHVGHLRSAVIGESIKRIARYMGHKVIGDVHLGDWGLQMGLIITELHERKPDLVYFDESYTGEYPKEPPFTISELEEIYPFASGRSKEDESYHEKALEATNELQKGRRGYQALLKHIMDVSVTDLKKNYEKLNVSFDLWKGESDAAPYIPDMVKDMKDKGLAYESDGALVVDVKEESDKKEIPPCMILKSDGAALYNTTDLATMIWRVNDYHPDRIAYVVDKRQELHFIQCFRAARKCGIVPDNCALDFIRFGTMNGKDGKPFKTREGGVMRLSNLIADVDEQMYKKIRENNELPEDEAKETANTIALAAIKYGDLSNQPSKDYVFDIDKFTSFEGNTGPYILYTIVRMKSIIRKYEALGKNLNDLSILPPETESERSLLLALAPFQDSVRAAYDENMPNRICQYIYELSNAFNHFYHETKILACEDDKKQKSYMSLLSLTLDVLTTGIDLLGFKAPERM